jgi:ABC-type glycerol-3-phosphate transport system permease component
MAIGNFQPPPSIVSVNVVDLQFAAYTLASIPMILLFLFFMRYFVAGITSGAIKM